MSTFSDGTRVWNVDDLIAASQDLPVFHRDVDDFPEWDEALWDEGSPPTLQDYADHLQRVLQADLRYPLLLAPEGHLMDGAHRLVKARLLGITSVPCRQFTVTPQSSSTEQAVVQPLPR